MWRSKMGLTGSLREKADGSARPLPLRIKAAVARRKQVCARALNSGTQFWCTLMNLLADALPFLIPQGRNECY